MTPQEIKYLKIGGAVLGAGVVLYLIFGDKFDNSSAGAENDPTGNGGVSNPTGTSNFNAKNIANDLYENMQESGFASFMNPNERDNIFNVLKNVSQTQFGQVVTQFGRKSYNESMGNQLVYTPWGTLPLFGLKTWLKTELTDADYNLLRKKYPNYL
jgi:hypothetical protein